MFKLLFSVTIEMMKKYLSFITNDNSVIPNLEIFRNDLEKFAKLCKDSNSPEERNQISAFPGTSCCGLLMNILFCISFIEISKTEGKPCLDSTKVFDQLDQIIKKDPAEIKKLFREYDFLFIKSFQLDHRGFIKLDDGELHIEMAETKSSLGRKWNDAANQLFRNAIIVMAGLLMMKLKFDKIRFTIKMLTFGTDGEADLGINATKAFEKFMNEKN
eukprot:NODE_322_length_9794_cov_0.486643.p5 type:complete len:216 gc:universal NODE_322_length_9794_cov_0.486643:5907-6554(+)